MSQLLDLLNGTVTGLLADSRLAGVNVSAHGGEFTDVEIKAYGAKSPHIVVAILRSPITLQGGKVMSVASMIAVTIETDRKGVAGDRTSRVLALTDAALQVISKLPIPDMTGLSYARDVDARNLHSPAWDRSGLAAWAISWYQTVELKTPTNWAAFKTLDTKYDLVPHDNDAELGEVIEAEDLIDLES